LGSLVFIVGLIGGGRFIYFYWIGEAYKHLASLVASAVFMILGFQVVLIGLVADAISGTRRLMEDLLYRARSAELDRGADARTDDGSPRRWRIPRPSRS